MTIETPLHAAHQLDQLAGQFEAWRQRRAHPHEPIPDALWAQAVALTTTLPPARVAKQLRLRGHDLKKQIRQRQGAPETGPAPRGFVEVPPLPTGPPAPDSLDIEIQRPDGTRLRLLAPAVSLALATFVQSFVEARPCSNEPRTVALSWPRNPSISARASTAAPRCVANVSARTPWRGPSMSSVTAPERRSNCSSMTGKATGCV